MSSRLFCPSSYDDPQYLFDQTQEICIWGDVDYTCPEELGIQFPGADIYVVATGDPNPFNAVTAPIHLGKIMGGAGTFWAEKVWSPPLVPGTYDVLIDEHCDGVFAADDLLRSVATDQRQRSVSLKRDAVV